ncbi:hypothetical protein [Hymenobacter latericus]|uniref:hypothetical protein n=1 Tax=Hymenobacter sp. YIM 151858-1 TaxID=2987688 RepID=UPI0022278727|nr:hypothetical protein [Hymenobacter sp. YIM 151858-1]UYZ61176.1 hypothetical protein OIS50_19595 [Hymenobacter sp. YIM 151858-1]
MFVLVRMTTVAAMLVRRRARRVLMRRRLDRSVHLCASNLTHEHVQEQRYKRSGRCATVSTNQLKHGAKGTANLI